MSMELPPNTKILKNGAVYSMDEKRIVSGAVLDSATARDMVRAREEKRMRLYAEGAQLSVQNQHLIKEYGTDAHIVERAMTLQTIASTPDAGKAAVLAAIQLDKAQGLDNGKQEQAQGHVTNVLMLGDAEARLLQAIARLQVVDAEVSEE